MPSGRKASKTQVDQSMMDEYQKMTVSFRRALVAQNKSPRTVTIYLESLEQFHRFLVSMHMPTSIAAISREHIETFIADQLARLKPNSARVRYAGLHVFFNWLVEEGELTDSPMKKMKKPNVPEDPPPVLSDEQLRAILATCKGNSFLDRRDTAIIRLLIDTGMRRQEITNIKVSDIDWDLQVIRVRQKGQRIKVCVFGKKTAQALDRYLRSRARHNHADAPELWIGHQGKIGAFALGDIIVRRCNAAGIAGGHTHLFRHLFAHKWLEAGGQETDLMRLAGWTDRSMLAKYAASTADSRARESHRLYSPGDRI